MEDLVRFSCDGGNDDDEALFYFKRKNELLRCYTQVKHD